VQIVLAQAFQNASDVDLMIFPELEKIRYREVVTTKYPHVSKYGFIKLFLIYCKMCRIIRGALVSP